MTTHRKSMRALFAMFSCLMALLFSASPGSAADKHTLTCISAWPKMLDNVQFFLHDFLEVAQKEADRRYPGELKLVYKGGPEVVATNEQITAVGKGMVDMVFGSTSYYVSKIPETDLLNISPLKPWEEKAVGLYDYLDKLHNEKTNTHFLVQNGVGLTFQFALIKPVKTLDDFKGMSLRANPTTVQLMKAMEANPVQINPVDVYTALERGVIQGYAMPAYVIPDFGLTKVTKYLVFPGFYNTINNTVINLDSWNKLPKHLQDLLTEQADIHSRRFIQHNLEVEKIQLAKMKESGITFIELPKGEGDKLVQMADDAMVNTVMERAPVEGKKILEYLKMKPK